jgi:hypothetical protein
MSSSGSSRDSVAVDCDRLDAGWHQIWLAAA